MATRREVVREQSRGGDSYLKCRLEEGRLEIVASIEERVEMVMREV